MTRLTKPKSTTNSTPPHRLGSTEISARAMFAWGRIPSKNKAEIIAAVEQTSTGEAEPKTVKLGNQTLKVRNISSGFRVIYETRDDHNTIVSVLTPREARLAKG